MIMTSSVKLKIKCDSSCALVNLLSTSTIQELIDEIRKVTDIGNDDVNLLTGFPPKPILMDLELTLLEAKIRSGDCIILKRIEESLSCKKIKLDSTDEIAKIETKDDQPTALNEKNNENEKLYLESLLESQHKMSATILTKQTIPADNSCLFASVYFCLNNASLVGFHTVNERELIAAMLLSQPDKFDIAFLEGKTPETYCEWIMDVTKWGGSIELHLLSCLNKIEIDVVNINFDRIDRFGEDKNHSHKILILYDGIHYDALASEDINTGKLITKFNISDQQVMEQARQMAAELKSSKQFTDTHRFKIMCQECQAVFTGQSAAVKHANATKHSNFGEIDSN